MTHELAPPRHSLAANVGWFSLVFLISSLAMSFVVTTFAFFVRSGVVSLIGTMAAFAVAAWLASDRFADKRPGDLGRHRTNLAALYALAAAATTFLLSFAPFIFLLGTNRASVEPHNVFSAIVGVVVGVAITTIANAVIGWFVLGRFRGIQKQ